MIILVVLNTMFESAKTEKLLKKMDKGNHELKFVKMMLLFHMLLTL